MPPNDYSRTNSTNQLGMTITVDGVSYPFRLSDISAAMELELYQQTGGLRLTQVVQDIAEAPAGFHIAALVFLARRSRGDQVTFDEIASHMGLASDIDVVMEDDTNGAVDALPEAQGVN